MFAVRSLCDDFYCDCDFCESFGAPEVRRGVFKEQHGRAALEAELMRRVIWLLDTENFVFTVDAVRLVQLAVSFHAMLDPKPGTYREFWDLAGRTVDFVNEEVAQKADWDRQEAEWHASGGYWLGQDL